MTSFEREQFAVDLTDRTPDKSQWLAIMRFGLDSLLKEPKLLMELIARRAVREKFETKTESKAVSDFAAEILGELRLKFVVETNAE
jgi:hypothetical protein